MEQLKFPMHRLNILRQWFPIFCPANDWSLWWGHNCQCEIISNFLHSSASIITMSRKQHFINIILAFKCTTETLFMRRKYSNECLPWNENYVDFSPDLVNSVIAKFEMKLFHLLVFLVLICIVLSFLRQRRQSGNWQSDKPGNEKLLCSIEAEM